MAGFSRRHRRWRGFAAASGVTYLSYAGAQSVNTDGFTFEDADTTVVASGTNQAVNYDKTDQIFVKRQGFSGVNVAATPVDTLTVMSRFRKRYAATTPNHTEWEDVDTGVTPNAVRAVLNEFIYANDTIYGSDGTEDAITNNSVLDYPLPIPRWLNAPYTRVSAATADKIYLFVDHAYARDGTPVAAIRISVTDGSTTLTYDATTMVKKSYTASGLTVPCYEFSPDWSAFTTDATITIDALIYPHVGEPYQASVDGSNTDHTANFGVLRVWNAGTTFTYAYVDGVGGGTPAISTTAATAAAAPYATIAAAGAALSGQTNPIIRLTETTHTVSDFSTMTVDDGGVLIESAPATTAANVICLHADVNDVDTLPDITHWRNLKIQKDDTTAATRWSSDAGLATKNYQCLENITFELTGAGTLEAAMWAKAGVLTLINCTGDNLGQSTPSGTTKLETNAYGCHGRSWHGTVNYNAIACNAAGENANGGVCAAATSRNAGVGQCFAFSVFSLGAFANNVLESDEVVGARGVSFSGTICEAHGSHTSPAFFANADSSNDACQNVVAHQMTVVGNRTNWMYAPSNVGTVTKRGFMRNVIMMELNTKSDVFETDATKLGNESEFYRVGMRNIMLLEDSSNSNTYGVGNWIGEVEPLNTTNGSDATPQDPGFADDQSNDGSDGGDGDYTPTIANMASDLVPAADVCFRCDQAGTDWALDGSDAKGALAAA